MKPPAIFAQVKENISAHLDTTLGGLMMSTCSLVVFGVFVLVYVNLIQITGAFFHQSHYSVFLTAPSSPADRLEVKQKVSSLQGTQNVHLISPHESRADLMSTFSEAKGVLEKINLKKLPWVIDFSIDSETPLSQKARNQLEMMEAVDEVYSGRETQEQVENFFQLTNFIGYFLVSLLFITIGYIIQYAIMLGIRSRTKEIEVFTLLGATSGFIQAPFLIEGALMGVVSGLAADGSIYLLYRFLLAGVTFNSSTFGLAEAVSFFGAGQQVVLVLVMGLMGLLASGRATRRILQELRS